MRQNLSLASIINESQQGEQAARRAVPSQRGFAELDLSLSAEKPQKPQERNSGLKASIEDQQSIEQQLEEKKKAMQAAEEGKPLSSIDPLKQIDYTQTFLKIFGLA